MSKAYSNKALPHGTVLREWRLEEVLGVGGFGIVYKARGIYFNELVAIKEYFPSAISERDEDATVVPVDSDAEEVHALGLKKFVEEAKLLWNLSSPSRHPNIVSVRSLFEVHGTAYMVMDFEDGTSLSKLLKNGVRFNEASLKEMIVPMAQGLERAHRVGVLHRDIKPPNIILNDSGKSVLIDFGSARFESGEATSTTVTFHTPPYAAIEQYVKTFTQGPWTDIYALGVVLYECVTGTKPPEVLERMHTTAGTPLAEGNWPGYSKGFLAAIDAAMQVRPEDRPRSISDWLPMLAVAESGSRLADDDDDDTDEDVTRIMSLNAGAPSIVPVAPPPPGFGTGDLPASNVPDDPKQAQFKKAGGETDVGKRVATEAEARKRKPPILDKADAAPPPDAPAPDAPAPTAPAPAALPLAALPSSTTGQDGVAGAAPPATPAKKPAPAKGGGMRGKAVLAAGALVLAGGAGWAIFGGKDPAPVVTPSEAPVLVNTVDAMGPALLDLAADAREAGVSAPVVAALDAQAALVQADIVQLHDLSESGAAAQLTDKITQATVKAANDFTAALVSSGQDQVTRAYRTYPWANPSGSARQQTSAQRQAAGQVRAALEDLRATANPAGDTVAAPGTPAPSVSPSAAPSDSATAAAAAAIASARQAMERLRTLGTAIAALATPASANATVAAVVPTVAPRTPVAEASQQVAAPVASASQSARPSAGNSPPMTAVQKREINRVVDRAQDVARDVIRLEGRNRPGANATEAEREGYAIRQADGQTAREYQAYLRTLESSLTNSTTSAEGDRMLQQANQTLGYLRELLNRSNATLR